MIRARNRLRMVAVVYLAALLACGLFQTAISQSLPDTKRMLTQPQNCTGWPEPRMWIETQQWWTDPGLNVSSDSRHFHLGGCMPYNQTLTGVVTLDILVQLHYNPAYLIREIYFLAPLPYNSTGIVTDTTNHRIGASGIMDWSCTGPILTCMTVVRIDVDTSLVEMDCIAALRMRAETGLLPGVVADLANGTGYLQVPELSFPVYFQNGKKKCPYRDDPNNLPGVPTIATAFNDFPWSYTRMTVFKDTLPTAPVSGKWVIRQLMSFDQRLFGRVTPVVAPVTRSFVTVNPRFHVIDPITGDRIPMLGTIQLDVNNAIYQNLTIDTTLLNNGRNILFFRTDAYIAPGTILPDDIPWLPGVKHWFSGKVPHPGGTTSSVLTFSFFVNNPPPTPAPSNTT